MSLGAAPGPLLHESNATRPSAVRWRVLALLMLLAFVSYLLRGNLSIAAPMMIADLRLTEIQWGWIMSAFPLGYALLQFPGGVWGNHIGPRLALALIASTWTLLIVVTSLVPGTDHWPALAVVAALMAVQFLVGAAHAPIFPLHAVSLERWFPRGQLAWPFGLTSTALTVGLAATASLLPWLIDAHGWRISFLFIAPFGAFAAALWWWYGRDRPALHPAVNAAEIALINTGRAPMVDAAGAPPGWLRVLKNRDVLLLTLSYSCMNFVFYVVFSWGFYYLVTVREFSAQDAGFLTSAQWLFAGIGGAMGGYFSDRLCRRLGLRWGCRWPIVVGMLASAALLLGVAFHPNPWLAAVMLGLCFFCNQATEGPYWATSAAVGGRHAGAAGGLMNTGANLMGFVNALLLALVADRLGWPAAIAVGAGFAVLAAGLIVFVRADCQIDQAA